MTRYYDFIDDVINNKERYPLTIQQLVKRQQVVIDNQHDDDYPFYFDEDTGYRVVQFIERLKQFKDRFRGQFLTLQPWQVFLVASLFGTKRKADDLRRYRQSYNQMPRKMGKTILAAGIGLYQLSSSGGEEIYSIATKKEQAKLTYDAMKGMIKQIPKYDKYITVHQADIVMSNDSIYKPMSAEDNTSDGLNPSFVIVDEYHEHKNDKLFKVYEDGMGARSQPMMFIITTAGYNKGVCYDEYVRCKKVLSGEFEDDELFPMIWEMDEDDDWEDERNWIKVNPNLEVIVPMDYLRSKYRKAVQSNNYSSFKTKNLNLWTTDNTDTWIDSKSWSRCIRQYSEDALIGRRCYGGIDLAGVRDLTSYTLYFPMDDGTIIAKHKVYVPESSVEQKTRLENQHFPEWIVKGLVRATPGEVTDHKILIDDIIDDGKKYDIIELGYDPHRSGNIISFLEHEGFTLLPIKQGMAYFTQPCLDWEASVFRNRIIDPDPIMEWCISNVVIKPDHKNNFIPLKKDDKKTNKIDLVISSVIAHKLLIENEEGFKEMIINPIDLWVDTFIDDTDEEQEKRDDDFTISNDNPLDLWALEYSKSIEK